MHERIAANGVCLQLAAQSRLCVSSRGCFCVWLAQRAFPAMSSASAAVGDPGRPMYLQSMHSGSSAHAVPTGREEKTVAPTLASAPSRSKPRLLSLVVGEFNVDITILLDGFLALVRLNEPQRATTLRPDTKYSGSRFLAWRPRHLDFDARARALGPRPQPL